VYFNSPGCPGVGWGYQLNTNTFAAGAHTLAITATDAAGNTGSVQTLFTTGQPPAVWVNIDRPANGSTVSGAVVLSGWAIESAAGSATIKSVAVYVDGNLLGTATYGAARPDVCSAYPGRSGCPNVGWSYTLDTTQWKGYLSNAHTLLVIATDSADNTGSAQVVFTASQMLVNIDQPLPYSTFLGQFAVSGWAIPEAKAGAISSLFVYVDGNFVSVTPTLNIARPDVCAVYAGAAGCPNVGWSFTLDTAQFVGGRTHTVTVIVYDSAGNSGSASVDFHEL
jgi:hypothetical protein